MKREKNLHFFIYVHFQSEQCSSGWFCEGGQTKKAEQNRKERTNTCHVTCRLFAHAVVQCSLALARYFYLRSQTDDLLNDKLSLTTVFVSPPFCLIHCSLRISSSSQSKKVATIMDNQPPPRYIKNLPEKVPRRQCPPFLPPFSPKFINDLPEEVLRLIFDRAPVSNLLRTVPKVCPLWHSLAPTVCAIARPLALRIGTLNSDLHKELLRNEFGIEIPHLDQLVNPKTGRALYSNYAPSYIRLDLHTFTLNRAKQLAKRLTKITELELYLVPYPGFDITEATAFIIHLLKAWSSTLISLKLRCLFSIIKIAIPVIDSDINISVHQIIDTINQLPLVERLILDFQFLSDQSLDLPILARLKEFGIFSGIYQSFYSHFF